MSPEQVRVALADYFARLNSMDPEQLIGAFAADAVGNDARREMYSGVTEVFRDIMFAAEHTYIVGNQVAMKWSARGTTMQGKSVTFDGIDVLTFNDAGKLHAQVSYWDPDALVAQLED